MTSAHSCDFVAGRGSIQPAAHLLLAPIPVVTGAGVFYALRLMTSIVSIRSLALGLAIPVMKGSNRGVCQFWVVNFPEQQGKILD
jgi:hypothetical protein